MLPIHPDKMGPRNIYLNTEDMVVKHHSPESIPCSSKDSNLLLPPFEDVPVIETAAFKAYLVLAEENIFLQNDDANGSRIARRRAQRHDLLTQATTAGEHSVEVDDSNDEHSASAADTSNNSNAVHHAIHENNENNSSSNAGNESESELTPAVLRGILVFRVLKPNTKIKSINLNFRGDSRTNWPEGIPPKKTEFVEYENIFNHEWNFFNIADHSAERYTTGGANHINTLPVESKKIDHDLDIDKLDLNDPSPPLAAPMSLFSSITAVNSNSSQMSSRRFLGLRPRKNMLSRAGNSLVSTVSNTVSGARKSIDISGNFSSARTLDFDSPEDLEGQKFDSQGNYVFHPGDYIYNFEKTIPQSCPESLNLTFGMVNYWLNLEICRVGKFKSVLRSKKKINLIRTNSSQSIEENLDPIMINKSWEDRLSYSILIASNSVILNSFMPINIRLVPTDKNIKLYKIKIFIVEILEYWCKDRKVHRLEPQRKFLLLEHRPKIGTNLLRDFDDSYSNSVITDKSDPTDKVEPAGTKSHLTVNEGNDIYLNERSPSTDSSHLKKNKKPHSNTLEDDEEEYISSKDFNYQLYVPERFTKFSSKLHPDAKHKNIQCHHWIKISLRLSKKLDDFSVIEDPEPGATELSRVLRNETGSTSDSSDGASPQRPSFNHLPSRRRGHSESTSAPKRKRKHYEISIDSPIALLHPLCTQANTLLPAYDGVGAYDPYTYAKRKENGEIEILTNNDPLFPPEILSSSQTPFADVRNIADDTDTMATPSALEAHRSPAIPTENNVLSGHSQPKNNSKQLPPGPTGQDFSNLDHEFQAEVTEDMVSSNLYQPVAVDMDLVAEQATPLVPKSLSPNLNGEALSPHLSPHLSPNSNLSPNFRALSPSFKAMSPTFGGSRRSSVSSIKSPHLVASNLHSKVDSSHEQLHLLTKPPIKPPSYPQSIGLEPLDNPNNPLLSKSLEPSASELLPPSYDDINAQTLQLKTHMKWQIVNDNDDSSYDISDLGSGLKVEPASDIGDSSQDSRAPKLSSEEVDSSIKSNSESQSEGSSSLFKSVQSKISSKFNFSSSVASFRTPSEAAEEMPGTFLPQISVNSPETVKKKSLARFNSKNDAQENSIHFLNDDSQNDLGIA